MATESGDEAEATEDTGVQAEVEYPVSSDDRTWGILVHAAAFVGLVVPLGNILAPFVIWLIKKEESRFVDENGKQALNFQLTWTILLVVAGLTVLIGIGLLLAPLVGLAWLILVVIATVRASEDQVYDYPLTIEFVS